jgi:TolB-like protein/class 3 adenylate cyclase
VASEGTERRLAAVLVADVVGYSRLMAEDQDATVRTVTAYRAEVELLVRQHQGRLVDFTGDNFLAEFSTALESVRCAVEIQRVLTARNADLAAERRMQFRMGVHLGDVTADAERLYGDGVNIAARLQALADPGGVCVSANVHDLVRTKLGVGFDDLGAQSVKNIPDPVRVYRVRIEAGAVPAETSPRSLLRMALVVGAVVLLGAFAVAGWRMFGGGAVTPAETPIRSIAVLPLENLSGDPEQEYFADGMTEALIGDLAKINSLRVISRTSVMQYKRNPKSLPEIARELGVDAVVEGTVAREGGRVRVTAQLIDARSDDHLWADRYDRERVGVLALQSELARAIAAEVRAKLTPEETARLTSARSVDPEAHEAYLKARYYYDKFTTDDMNRSVEYFQRAIERDPRFAPAHAGLSHAYIALGTGVGSIPGREAMPKAKAAALEALEIDGGLAQAHTALGIVLLRHDWDFAAAERELRRAIEIEPSYAEGHRAYTEFLWAMGRHQEAVELGLRAVDLAPLDLRIRVLASETFFFAREFERGLEELEAVLELDPDYPRAHQDQVWLYEQLGWYEQAVAASERLMTLSGDYEARDIATLRESYETSGAEGYWRGWLEALHRRARDHHVKPSVFVWYYAGLGDTEQAFRWLDQAYEERDSNLIWLNEDPAFDPLRSDPRFDDLLRRIGFPEN